MVPTAPTHHARSRWSPVHFLLQGRHRVAGASAPWRWAFGFGLFGVALWSRFALVGVLPASGFPFLTFFPAVLLAAWIAGLGPGLAVAGLSVLAAWYWFLGVDGEFGGLSRPDVVALVFFGAILAIDCVVLDVMNRALDRLRAAEREVRASEHRLRRVLDGLFVDTALLDVDGRLREVNQASLLLGGKPRDDLLGRPLWELPGWIDRPDLQEPLRDAVRRAAAGERVRMDLPLAVRGRAGATLDLQVAPLRDDDRGPVAALVVCGVDVTARVEALDALQRRTAEAQAAAESAAAQRRLLDAVFDAAPAAIIVADAQGRLVRMNRATTAIWGDAPATAGIDAYGAWRGWWADGGPRDGQPLGAHDWGLARALEHGEHCRDIVAVEPFGGAGDRVVTLLSSAPVRDAAGGVIGAVVAQIDITERVTAERALREADRQKDTFLATLAHELRNPLAPIRAAAQVIRQRPTDDAAVRRMGDIVERQSAHLARLVDDLLDVSRITLGTVTLQRARCDLRQAVERAVEIARPRLEAGGQHFVMRLPPHPVHADIDETRIAQAVANLLDNACKFTPRGRRVVLDVTVRPATPATRQAVPPSVGDGAAAEEVAITVHDEGRGIAPEALPRIFELFVQAEPSGLGGHSGLGIGLALTRRLVAMHGGRLAGCSEGEGHGAVFEIALPLPATAEAERDVDRTTPASGPVRPVRVLVVDDNADTLESLEMLLRDGGHTVLTAADGAQAVAAEAAQRPDVVLLDIGLPDLSGFEVARRIRSRGAPQPRLVALTGWGQDHDRRLAADAGFDDHLTKPADAAALGAAVDAARGRPAS